MDDKGRQLHLMLPRRLGVMSPEARQRASRWEQQKAGREARLKLADEYYRTMVDYEDDPKPYPADYVPQEPIT